MKSLEELAALREKMRPLVDVCKDSAQEVRVEVGMATCGIAAGARPVMLEFVNEIGARGLRNVVVTQTGCIGLCKLEPIVIVKEPGKEDVAYVEMTPARAKRVVAEHLVNGQVIKEYTVGAAKA